MRSWSLYALVLCQVAACSKPSPPVQQPEVTDPPIEFRSPRPPNRSPASASPGERRRAVQEAVSPPSSEMTRIFECAGWLAGDQQVRVRELLQARVDQNPEDPGFDRFIQIGASSSRDMYYMTGFGRDHHTLDLDWEFLQTTIDHFAVTPGHNSFVRKNATESSTGAGNFLYSQKRCPDCPARLDRELRTLTPAFALVMFGTNNARWQPPPNHRRWFFRRVAAHPEDPCLKVKGKCLPPWSPGPLVAPPGAPARVLAYVKTGMKNKRRHFRVIFKRLVKKLLRLQIVPVLSTLPPMPRFWPEEATIVALNDEIRQIAVEFQVPLLDAWCALNPMQYDSGGVTRPDWDHPVIQNRKGLRRDRVHPAVKNAFDVSDENLVYGQNVRNVMALIRLQELVDLSAELSPVTPQP